MNISQHIFDLCRKIKRPNTYVALGIGLCIVAPIIHRWYKRILPRKVTKLVEQTIADVDQVDSVDAMYLPNGDVFKGGKYISSLVQEAKAEFGPLKRLEANRLMVRKFLLDKMTSRKMRPTHIANYLDIAVSMVFIPSASEIIAHQINATSIAIERDSMVVGRWYTPFGYFSRMRCFTNK